MANRGIAAVVAAVMVMNVGIPATAQSAAIQNRDNTAVLLNAVKTLQAGIDSGKVQPEEAIDAFSKTVLEQNVSLQDVDAFVKSRMTAAEYAAFRNTVKASLRGVDASTLSAEETAEIIGRAMAGVRAEGLYWSGCAQLWTGAAVVAAAVVGFIVAAVKNKSVAEIQQEYADLRNGTTDAYNAEIASTQNWETSFPSRIEAHRQALLYLQYEYDNLERQLYYEQDSARRSQIQSDMQSIQYAAISHAQAIQDLQARLARYQGDASLVAGDIAAFESERDQALADLNAGEAAALESQPKDAELAKKLRIGGGIGAAIGAAMITHGVMNGASCSQ